MNRALLASLAVVAAGVSSVGVAGCEFNFGCSGSSSDLPTASASIGRIALTAPSVSVTFSSARPTQPPPPATVTAKP